MNIISHVDENTNNFWKNKSKSERKKIGQFFTNIDVADFMSSMFKFNDENITILDPGAGSGVLTVSLCNYIVKNKIKISSIKVDLYENNEDVIPLLYENMNSLKDFMKANNINFHFYIYEENFITYNKELWSNTEFNGHYDFVIMNPPYKKIGKNEVESLAMIDIVHGQPNIYFLFISLSIKLLKTNGQLVTINPRSFCSGAYFKKFRGFLTENSKLSNIHLFVSRDTFGGEVLQETIILKLVKTTDCMNSITITESQSMDDIDTITVLKANYSDIVKSDDNKYIFLPTNSDDVELLKTFAKLNYTLPLLDFELKTGIVVDFRSREYLTTLSDGNYPLFWSSNFFGNIVDIDASSSPDPQYIIENQSFFMENKDYLFIKRITSKEEKRRIQPAIYLKEKFSNYKFISTENHINYITKKNAMMSKEELLGLFVLINTSYIDKYYRLLNGSTQVNATEFNTIPMPSINTIIKIGIDALLLGINNLSPDRCDELFDKHINN